MRKDSHDQLVDASHSFEAARVALEATAGQTKPGIVACVKEALEELDYAQECLTKVAAVEQPLTGRNPSAIYDYVKGLQSAGLWHSVGAIEELAERAASEWERYRGRYPHDVIPFEFPIDPQGHLVSVPSYSNGPNLPPMNMQAHTYRILLPGGLADRNMAKWVARRQIEEVMGL